MDVHSAEHWVSERVDSKAGWMAECLVVHSADHWESKRVVKKAHSKADWKAGSKAERSAGCLAVL